MHAERWLIIALALGGCAVDLDDAPKTAAPHPAPLELESCELFPQLDMLEGLARPATLPDGRELTILGRPDFDGATASAAFEGTGRCGASALPLATRPIIDASPQGTDWTATPRASFTTDAAYLFFSLDRGFDSRGSGIARYDEESEAFVAEAMLWTSDRPSYGAAAIIDGEYIYVYGGTPARFLAADVYLARVRTERVTDPNAYEYFQGGGEWATDPDLAGPLLEGGTTPSVVWNAEAERYLMAYATPLAREITLRSGLGPAGPWSRPFALGACALPFAEAFCNEVAFLPAFAGDGEVALAQTVVDFEAPANTTPADYRTRLVKSALPRDLP